MKRRELPERFELGFLRTIDKRSSLYQRLTTAYHNVVNDLGGFKVLSHVRIELIQRLIFLCAALERMEQQMAENPKTADDLLGKHTQCVNTVMGLAKTVGLDKSEAELPSIKAYVESKKRA